MKILIVAPYFFERHRWMISAYKTALELSKDHQVVVLTTGKPKYERLNNSLTVYRMWDLFLPDPINYSVVPNLPFRLWSVIRRERPDVFLVNKHMFWTSFSVFFLRLMGKKVVMVTDTFPGLNWMPRRVIVRWVMRVYAWVIGVPLLKLSTFVVLLHEGLLPLAHRLRLRSLVIHNGVNTELYDNAEPNTDIPTSPEHINIGYIGRLETIKGYDDVLAVAQMMAKEDSRIHFYFVGNTKGKETLVQEYQSANIHFLGHRDDLPSLYPRFQVFVLASYSEGLPNALMEAMYCRCACVASAVGGVHTLIRDGEDGLLFHAGDREGLRARIEMLVRDPALRARLGDTARTVIQHGYRWEDIRVQYTALFQTLIPR
jgi:glycosyltransferase involved in cell wall biosynthesis